MLRGARTPATRAVAGGRHRALPGRDLAAAVDPAGAAHLSPGLLQVVAQVDAAGAAAERDVDQALLLGGATVELGPDQLDLPGPVQLNLPFREPLAPATPGTAEVPRPETTRSSPPEAQRRSPAIPMSGRVSGPADAGRLAELAVAIRAAPRGLILSGLVDPAILGVDERTVASNVARGLDELQRRWPADAPAGEGDRTQ